MGQPCIFFKKKHLTYFVGCTCTLSLKHLQKGSAPAQLQLLTLAQPSRCSSVALTGHGALRLDLPSYPMAVLLVLPMAFSRALHTGLIPGSTGCASSFEHARPPITDLPSSLMTVNSSGALVQCPADGEGRGGRAQTENPAAAGSEVHSPNHPWPGART